MSENGKISAVHDREQLLERLTAVVGAYGADRARWPAADRHVLRMLLASDSQAQHLLSEAAAMDQLLAFADQGDYPSDSAMDKLSNRIMSQLDRKGIPHSDRAQPDPAQPYISGSDIAGSARLEQAELSVDANVIAFPIQRSQPQKYISGSADNAQMRDWSLWAGRVALAASLAIGIFVGANGYLEQTTHSMTALAGLDFTPETSALIDDGFGGPEEEFL